jgi:hypothetical protein
LGNFIRVFDRNAARAESLVSSSIGGAVYVLGFVDKNTEQVAFVILYGMKRISKGYRRI